MKKYISCLVIALVCSMAMLVSCSEKGDDIKIAKPGTYFTEAVVETLKKPATQNDQLSRGLVPSNNDFDLIYDPDYIYLHVVGSGSICSLYELYNPEYKEVFLRNRRYRQREGRCSRGRR